VLSVDPPIPSCGPIGISPALQSLDDGLLSLYSGELAICQPSLWTVNIATYVTTILASVDDYLSREMQFLYFVIMHQLLGMLDASILSPSSTVLIASGVNQPNPTYFYWLQVNQLIRSWIFAIIAKETLREVRNIPHALPVWQHLASHFNTASLARALDLKCMLTNVSKGTDQTMEDYSHSLNLLLTHLLLFRVLSLTSN